MTVIQIIGIVALLIMLIMVWEASRKPRVLHGVESSFFWSGSGFLIGIFILMAVGVLR